MSSTKVKKLAFGGNVPRSTPEWYAQQAQAQAAERLANPQAHSAAVRAARGAAIQQQAKAMLNRPQLTGLQKAERNAAATAARQAASDARNAARGIRPRPAAAPAAPVPQAAPGPNPKTAEIQEMVNNPKLQALVQARSAPKPSTGPSWSEQMTLGLNPPQNPPLAAQRPNQKARNAAAQPGSAGWSERMTLGLNPPQAAPVQRTRNVDRAIRPRPAAPVPPAPIPQVPTPPGDAQGLNQKARNAAELSTGPSWSERPQAMKKGGSVRGGGCAAKGVGKGKMR